MAAGPTKHLCRFGAGAQAISVLTGMGIPKPFSHGVSLLMSTLPHRNCGKQILALFEKTYEVRS